MSVISPPHHTLLHSAKGLLGYPSKAQVVQSLRKAQTRGLSSAFFTGRYRLIQKMRAFFDENSEPQRQRRREFLLHGMGGAGKTQVALKVAEVMEEEDP